MRGVGQNGHRVGMVGDKIGREVEEKCLEFKGVWHGLGFRFVMLILDSIYPKQTCIKFESCRLGV